MHPEILQWGFLQIRSYGLMLALAFLAGTWLSLREARRLRLDEDRVVTVILVSLVAGVLGARMLYVLEHIAEFRREWGSVLALWQGGLTLYGGIVAGAVMGLLAAQRLGLPRWSVADALTPAIALGTAFGRMGCFLNGCCYGRPTSQPWGVTFPPDSFAGLEFGNARVHPSQLYFAIAGIALYIVSVLLRDRFRAPGQLFWTMLGLLALVRIPLDLTRAYESEAVLLTLGRLQVTESQVMSVALILFAALMFARLGREAGVSRGPGAEAGGPAAKRG
jgi:phosphatidylglycerol:prolipoprotein diacylglycerol transferase